MSPLNPIQNSPYWVIPYSVVEIEAKTMFHSFDDRYGSPVLLNDKGAVCEEVVIEMAKSAARLSGANFSIATSGIAGPGGGSAIKPVGTVWFAWLGPLGVRSKKYQFSGDRYAIREQSIEVALKEMLQHASQ